MTNPVIIDSTTGKMDDLFPEVKLQSDPNVVVDNSFIAKFLGNNKVKQELDKIDNQVIIIKKMGVSQQEVAVFLAQQKHQMLINIQRLADNYKDIHTKEVIKNNFEIMAEHLRNLSEVYHKRCEQIQSSNLSDEIKNLNLQDLKESFLARRKYIRALFEKDLQGNDPINLY